MAHKIASCLWFRGNAEDAARFYAQTFPDSRIDAINRSPSDYPDGKEGDVLTVEFTVLGMRQPHQNPGFSTHYRGTFTGQRQAGYGKPADRDVLGYDTRDFVAQLREQNVTPHVAMNATNRRSAIDQRTARHDGYAISQRKRKRVEEIFGCLKTVGFMRKTRHRGRDRVGWMFTFGLAAFNLVRIRNLIFGNYRMKKTANENGASQLTLSSNPSKSRIPASSRRPIPLWDRTAPAIFSTLLVADEHVQIYLTAV